jgi:hypothetical protein
MSFVWLLYGFYETFKGVFSTDTFEAKFPLTSFLFLNFAKSGGM